MITHFDKDHVSGYYYLTKMNTHYIFDEFYIPKVYFYKDTKGKKRNISIELAVYNYLFFPVGKTFNKSEALLNHVKIVCSLVKDPKNIIILQRNDNFYFDDKKFNVLWPEYKCDPLFYNKFITNLTEFENNIPSELRELKEEILGNMINWFDYLEDVEKEYKESSEKISDTIYQFVHTQDQLISRLEQIKSGTNINYYMKRLLYNLRSNYFYKEMNETSIVMHNDDTKSLFLGDATC
jgi:hypothetical protein